MDRSELPRLRAAVAVAAISFVIWVYVMKGDFGFYELGLKLIGGVEAPAPEKLELAKQFLSSLALVVWTLLVPVFYKGDLIGQKTRRFTGFG